MEINLIDWVLAFIAGVGTLYITILAFVILATFFVEDKKEHIRDLLDIGHHIEILKVIGLVGLMLFGFGFISSGIVAAIPVIGPVLDFIIGITHCPFGSC